MVILAPGSADPQVDCAACYIPCFMPGNAISPRLLCRFAFAFLTVCGMLNAQPKPEEWKPMFDGKTLQGWRETAYTERGEVRVEKGTIVLGRGAPSDRRKLDRCVSAHQL